MTEPPTYTVATKFDEIEQLREVIDALRANNGRLLRLLVKRLSTDPRPEAKELVETIVHHPQLRDLLGCVCYWHLADSLSGLAARPLLGAKANIRHHDLNDAYL
jgi:hypothetical protein